MAVTKVDIASRALVMIGANPIASFTDGTTEANVTNTIYEEIIESSLTRHNWRFATGQQQLSLLADSPTGRFEYAYQIPANPECLKILAVTVNDALIQYNRYEDKIYLDGFGSQSTVIMDYIFRQSEDQFPPHFRLAIEYKLASIFGGSVARDAALVREFDQLSERQMLIAKNTDSQETTTKTLSTDRFITERRSSRSGLVVG
jgi:hypothetical protein|tara:strand:- start:1547 stop:2155 length:609 start_codon:yes stop_codon:yes gene_type:complete